jgi:hypothetical protein
MKENNMSQSGAGVESHAEKPEKASKVLIILCVLLVCVNTMVSLALVDIPDQVPLTNEAKGRIAGDISASVILPLLVVGVFQIRQRFRNWKSRVKIVFWTSLVIFVARMGDIASLGSAS